MGKRWRTVKVFISPTFRDMQAERAHLVRVVLPELKKLWRGKRVHLVDVDLRCGYGQQCGTLRIYFL
jgi:hypothetical protein